MTLHLVGINSITSGSIHTFTFDFNDNFWHICHSSSPNSRYMILPFRFRTVKTTFFRASPCIRPQQGEKTFVNHLNKVVRTGKPFHLLTRELLAAERREGVMTPGELPRWQRMFAAAEEAVENNWEEERENQG